MATTIYDFLGHLDAIAPFALAEGWDNCGLQAGHPDGAVTRVMVALDVTMDVMTAALKWGADLVLTHHPLMIKPWPNSILVQCPDQPLPWLPCIIFPLFPCTPTWIKPREG